MIRRGLLPFTLLAVLLTGPAHSQTDAPSLKLVTPTLDLGVLHPEQTDQLPGALTAFLRAPGPWRVGLMRDPAATSRGRVSRIAPPDLFVKTPSGQWAPLVAGVPLLLASGGATREAGLALSFSVKAVPNLDYSPGSRSSTLFFTLDDQGVATPLQVTYEVAAATVLEPDSSPYRLRSGVDPSRPSQYAFERRSYKVYSNVPWLAEATLKGPMQKPGSQAALRLDAIAVTTRDGGVRPLTPGQPVQVGAGPASGMAGALLEVNLQFTLQDLLVEGDYASSIEITAKPAAIQETGLAPR
jgi:hypothetical protein